MLFKIAQTEPATLSKEQIEELLPYIDEIEEWAKKLKEYVLSEALKGVKFKGFKVVEGRSNRKVVDEAGLIKAFSEAGFPADLCYERKLLSLSKLEALVTKKKFAVIAKDFVAKEQGKPTLVPESDARHEYQVDSALEDFKDDLDDIF